MAKHQLRLHVGKEEVQHFSLGTTEPNEANRPVEFVRKFMRCPVHQEEPLQFFCLFCECECICAECALHGAHRGHDVMNLREAAKTLPERSAEMISTARIRSDELAGALQKVRQSQGVVAELFDCSRQELEKQFEQVCSGLLAEEKALLKEVQRCSTEVSNILDGGAVAETKLEDAIRDAEMWMSTHMGEQDMIGALTAYSTLSRLFQQVPRVPRPRISTTELKQQLQHSFQSRLAGMNSLSLQIENLYMESESGKAEEAFDIDTKPRFLMGDLTSFGAEEARAEERSNGPPCTPRFYGGSFTGADSRQDSVKGSIVLPSPTPSLGTGFQA
jgi:hypothetical protein